MKAFVRKDASAEPLLAASTEKSISRKKGTSSSSSSPNDDRPSTGTKGSGTLKAIISSALSCHAPPADALATTTAVAGASACSAAITTTAIGSPVSPISRTAPATPLSSPDPSPRQTRKEMSFSPSSPSKVQCGLVAKRHNMAMAAMQQQQQQLPNQGRKDPSYRHDSYHVISPTAISALNRRVASLPTLSSPSMSGSPWRERHARGGEGDRVDDDRAIKMSRSYGDNAYDCNYDFPLEEAYEDFGVERKLVVLKQPRLEASNRQKPTRRGRANSCPEVKKSKSKLKQPQLKDVGKTSSSPEVPPLVKTPKSKTNVPRIPSLPNTPKSSKKKSAPIAKGAPISVEKSMAATQMEPSSMRDVTQSAPAAEEELLREVSRDRADTERLLSQMGMDVTEEDYCIEGEFSSRAALSGQSFDCNYDHPLEGAYEDFGVERRLDEPNPSSPSRQKQWLRGKKKKKRARAGGVKKLVRSTLGSMGNGNHETEEDNIDENEDGRESNDRFLPGRPSRDDGWSKRSSILSILRSGGRRRGLKDGVPGHIVAMAVTPDSSEDVECVITPEDMRLLYRWQNARVRSAVLCPVTTTTAHARVGSRNVEEVLSITSSCSNKTALVDNRGRRHRQGVSF